jgi:hypothetical protein
LPEFRPLPHPRVSPDHLRGLSKGAPEGAAHPVAIGETRLPGDDVDRMEALLHHQPGGLDAQISRMPWPAIGRARRGTHGRTGVG